MTPDVAAATVGWGSLASSEVLRLRSRRAVRWLVGMAMLAVVFGALAGMLSAQAPSPGREQTAQARLERAYEQEIVVYQGCLEESGPVDFSPGACGPEPSRALTADRLLPYTSFSPVTDLRALVTFAGGLAAFVGFLVGATAVGADWTSRSMGLLLTWEPRRGRVLAVRTGVVAGATVALGVALMSVAAALGSLAVSIRGTWLGFGSSAWLDLLADSARLLLLVPLAGIVGLSLAMLARGTGFALGVAAGYVLVVESVVQAVWPWGSQWLVQTNALVVLSGEQLQWLVSRPPSEVSRRADLALAFVTITPTRAFLTLLALAGVVAVGAWVSFSRRDVAS